MKKNVVIIGGGIIGLSAAYYLNKGGCKVTVIDKGAINSGASFVNAGFISPSHVVPLAAPGMVAMGIKMMFKQSSPFYLKPRINADLWKWAYYFNKSATKKHVATAAPVIKELTIFSRTLFEDLKNEGVFDFHYEQKGLLMAYQTTAFEKKEAKLAKIATEQGLEVKHIDKNHLRNMEPEMKAEGAFYYTCDAHTTPDDFMQSFYNYLKNEGVHFFTNEEIVEFQYEQNKIIAVKTKNRKITLDELVLASGAWTLNLAKKLAIKLPVQAGKGYRINVYRNTGIKFPAILTEKNTAVTPMDGFTRFGGTMEVAGLNPTINKIRVEQIAKNANSFYPNVDINSEEIGKASFGFRPLSPDGLPFIGRSAKYNNLCIATGHAMMGWSQGPATGKLISEIVANKNTSISLNPFNLERFN